MPIVPAKLAGKIQFEVEYHSEKEPPAAHAIEYLRRAG